jgi:hypothetical protein
MSLVFGESATVCKACAEFAFEQYLGHTYDIDLMVTRTRGFVTSVSKTLSEIDKGTSYARDLLVQLRPVLLDLQDWLQNGPPETMREKHTSPPREGDTCVVCSCTITVETTCCRILESVVCFQCVKHFGLDLRLSSDFPGSGNHIDYEAAVRYLDMRAQRLRLLKLADKLPTAKAQYMAKLKDSLQSLLHNYQEVLHL